MNKELAELYSDYLLSSFGAATATGLSDMLEGEVSHDRITRFLSKDVYDSRTLWQQVKPMVRKIEQPDGVLIFDDTIEEKPHTDENEIVSRHFDHSENRTVKGINILSCVYHAQGVSLPVALEIIHKPIEFKDHSTGRLRRRSEVTKNELMRRMLRVCRNNGLEYSYVLADSWFSSKQNMEFIHDELGKQFVIALKSNRTVALSYEDKLQGGFHRPE
jgi:SRSO17 transposase